jgi:putative oxidoreductase
MSAITKYLAAFGRIVIGAVFLMSGLSKVGTYAAITAAITKAGLPLAPVGFDVALVVEIGLGLALLVGFRARWAAFGLAIWCLVTAAFFHNNFADQNMMIHFLKNVMIAAALLQTVHFGAGALSLDNRSSGQQA